MVQENLSGCKFKNLKCLKMIYVVCIIGAFIFMEFIAWFAHKYIMHRMLWYFHKDHHVEDNKKISFFEKNDFFFLIFALPAIILIFYGILNEAYIAFSIGIGITLYGITYFLIHDVYNHKRIKLFGQSENSYMKALQRAHESHHYPRRGDKLSYGLLLFPFSYFNSK